MPSLDWSTFKSLPGSHNQNLENICRGLVRLHYSRFGQFKALSNQPGVEFHIKLTKPCSLGNIPQWFGWQCKFHKRNQSGTLAAASRADIESSLRTTEKVLPGITDWILWTPYTLSKKDQNWFYNLETDMCLHLWSEEELDTYLNGEGLPLRNAYFGELVLSPQNLEDQHQIAVQPIRERWLEPVHQPVNAERLIRKMLGEPGAWDQMILMGRGLTKAVEVVTNGVKNAESTLQETIAPFTIACAAFADTLLRFHEILAQGDLDVIQEKLTGHKMMIDKEVYSTPRRLRTLNFPVALDATNALDDMRKAQTLLEEVKELLSEGLVAVLADAGGGKTQMAAQLTTPQVNRPAGVFLQGQNLHKGQTLNDLARHFSINGKPLNSMEELLASLDAAGKRASCRLPILIDGLNEAENPKDWKPALASLGKVIKKYPNVLVVSTLRTGERNREDEMSWPKNQTNARESFAVMALPDDVRRIETEGFGGDVYSAIDKYFSYFKINSGDAEIPVEFLKHPLTLRIYCQVTNPERETEVKVDHFPVSLSSLFEKYIVNVCERISQMVNLNYSYNISDVKDVIYKLGLEIWKVGKREVDEDYFRELVSDKMRAWDSSIINLLAQEGIVFRNPSAEPDKFVVTPVYDSLGGFMVSSALLYKHNNDTTFKWLNDQRAIKAFVGKDTHELGSDIFRSLVTLTPTRIYGKQLWKEAPDSLRNAALIYSTEIESDYIDEETVTELLKLLINNPKTRSYLFHRLNETRGLINHPLNTKFLDTALRKMTVSVRDLSWTEWIRKTRLERFNEILTLERGWKDNRFKRTPKDRLHVKWMMWHLSSTNRELRDIVTRALYWYGRGDPVGLFQESIGSIEINDPYIPERMIAASYGVAMALHVDIIDQNFNGKILPDYARHLYDMMFSVGAQLGTTHILMREYAYRTIEIASAHNPQLFTVEELKRTKPPFTHSGLCDWGESDITDKKYSHGQSPFRMDFENYTIGSLVSDRRNYDYEHIEYRKVRAQILWRIEQLGWTNDLFGEVDSSIESTYWSNRAGGDAKKTDRYGKKYSWIAYFEMSGYLQGIGKLENWAERTSKVDIDPSFPEPVAKQSIINSDYLGAPTIDTKNWIKNGPLPDISAYYRVKELDNDQGPWVALDGYCAQEDEVRGRSLFCFIRGFLVANENAVSIIDHLSRQDSRGRELPQKPSVIYTFAGEIPWCEVFPKNGKSEFEFVVNEKTVKVQRIESEYYLDGKKLDLSLFDLIRRRLVGETDIISEGTQKLSNEDLKRVEVRELPVEVEEVQKEHMKFDVHIPVCDFGWESYHTVASKAGFATTLAKEIALDLGLIGQPQTFDLYTAKGVRATYNVSDQSNDVRNMQSMFYIKGDLLENYLKKNSLTLVWAIWGERAYSSNIINNLSYSSDNTEKLYEVYSSVDRYNL